MAFMNQCEAMEAAKKLSWAKWIAQDRDGSWFAYDSEPENDGNKLIYSHSGSRFERLSDGVIVPPPFGPKIEVAP